MLDSMISTMTLELHVLSRVRRCAAAHGDRVSDRGSVSRDPCAGPGDCDRGWQRQALVGILPCHPALERHPDDETNPARIRNRAALEPILDKVFRQRTAAEWIDRLHGAGIPASLVRSFQEVAEHPQSAVREMFPVLDHPKAGPHHVTGTPVKLSETPGRPGAPAPLLGEHTVCTLQTLLGLDDSSIRALAARGVILSPEALD